MTEPGWLPDPTKIHENRWWDGAQWTDRVADKGVESQHSYDPGDVVREPPPAAPKSGCGGCLMVAVGVFLVILVISVVSNGGFSDKDDEPDEATLMATAFEACKDAVRSQLKSPGSASFRNLYEADGEVRVSGSPDRYEIASSVDAQNSFGADLRIAFACTATSMGGGSYAATAVLVE